MKHILILCTGNSCRSQIAHGYFSHFLNNEKVKVYSAGVETHGVNLRAIETMLEEGIDISQHTSNHIDEYRDVEFDLVFTVCDHAKERCPFFPTKAMKIHFNFPDPAKAQGSEEEIKQQFREVRDQIKQYVLDIINEHFLTEKK